MPELRELCDKIEAEVMVCREKAGAKPWAQFSRRSFIYSVENILPALEEIYSLFQVCRTEIEKKGESNKPEISPFLGEMNKHITLLKRNKEMEESRMEKLKKQGIHAIAETITVPDLYSDLEQKALALLLKSTYLCERIRVFERKREPVMHTKAAQRNVLDILEKREEELQNLRKKYKETRKNTFLGLVEKENSADLENELNELARKFETKTALMKKAFENSRHAFEHLENQMKELGEKVMAIEELGMQSTGKTFEPITMLKKERDYTKRMLIEIEQETIQLRNTYSKELLGLQEEKLSMRNALEERHSMENVELRGQIREQSETIKHLQGIVSGRDKKLSELEEENQKLELLNKTSHKHGKIKETFSTKGKKKKRKKN